MLLQDSRAVRWRNEHNESHTTQEYTQEYTQVEEFKKKEEWKCCQPMQMLRWSCCKNDNQPGSPGACMSNLHPASLIFLIVATLLAVVHAPERPAVRPGEQQVSRSKLPAMEQPQALSSSSQLGFYTYVCIFLGGTTAFTTLNNQ
jgi:hypothetical protein